MSAHEDTWTSGNIAWTPEEAATWVERCTNAGGVWTWSVGISGTMSILNNAAVNLMIATDAVIVSRKPNAAPTFNSSTIIGGNVDRTAPYSGNISSSASDINGDSITFAKLTGPEWLNVNTNGTLSGTPTRTLDIGMNRFRVLASDGQGDIDIAELEIIVNDVAANNRAYTSVSFEKLRSDLSTGMISGMSASDPDVDYF